MTADGIRTLLRGLGQTLITLGIVVLLFCGYELYFTNLYTAKEQSRLGAALHETWTRPPSPGATATPARSGVALGDGLAILWIPRIGMVDGSARVVVEGVSHEDLKRGPGHYPGTALPGQVGNVVISGHRTTYGAPFNRVDELHVGDPIVIETRDSWFTYRVTGETVVAPTAIEVTYPVPGERGATPTKRLLTLTTCNPKYSAQQRLIVHAELAATQAKSAGEPPVLAGRG